MKFSSIRHHRDPIADRERRTFSAGDWRPLRPPFASLGARCEDSERRGARRPARRARHGPGAANEGDIAAERARRAFTERRVDAQALATLTVEAGTAQAELHSTHLKYHFDTAAPMTPEQRNRCAVLRGYR